MAEKRRWDDVEGMPEGPDGEGAQQQHLQPPPHRAPPPATLSQGSNASADSTVSRSDMTLQELRLAAGIFGACEPLHPVPRDAHRACGPVWVLPPEEGSAVKLAVLLVEAFGQQGESAVAFASQCAEPLERCSSMHRYVITRPSLRRYPGGVEGAIERLRYFSGGAIPATVAAGLLSELERPCGVTVVVGPTCSVESGSLHELLLLRGDADVLAARPSEVQWREGVLRRDAEAVPFWSDIDSWQQSKIEKGRDAGAQQGQQEEKQQQQQQQQQQQPQQGGQGEQGQQEEQEEQAPPTAPAAVLPESLSNTLLLDDDDGSEFSFEAALAAEPPGGPEEAAPSARGEPVADVSCDAVVALCACLAAVRARGGVYRFTCPQAGVAKVRAAAREQGVRCWLEWELSELDAPDAGYTGPAPRFVPRTPRWTLAAVRSHQEAALNAIFPTFSAGPRAKSGVVALPCGAGKTMVGVLASAAVRAPSLVLCTSGIAVEQWVAQYGRWADLHTLGGRVARYTGKTKDKVTDATQVVITTYNMLMPRKRSTDGAAAVALLLEKHWGMVVLDEVHVLPAESCSTVIKALKSRAFLGLTATLVREDNKIVTLDHLIGPRLHEAEWGDLVKVGVLARVKCIEVRCLMSREFAGEYLRATKGSLQELLSCLNPSKLQATAAVVRHHEARGDKTLVFSDSLYVLKQLMQLLSRPAISGATGLRERLQLLSDFQSGTRLNTLIISRIGDCAIDLPAASVIVQVSSHFGSRRQEAQRLGRILRPKGSLIHPAPFVEETPTPFHEIPNALFYTMVSQDTTEVQYSHRRQAFLEEQGYSYQQVWAPPSDGGTLLGTKQQRVDLLARVLTSWQATKGKGDEEEARNVLAEFQAECEIERSPSPERPAVRRTMPLNDLSRLPGQDLIYGEWQLPAPVQ